MPPEENSSEADKIIFGNDSLIDHAVRCWEAETVNAARLSSRITQLFSGLVALFGLGLFKIEWLRRSDDVARVADPVAAAWIRWLLVAAVALFSIAFMCLILGRKKREHVHASEGLSLPDWYMKTPKGADWVTRKIVFICTYQAFLELQSQNTSKDSRIRRAQIPFVIGFALVVAAIL